MGKKSNVEFLISTMNKSDITFLKQMNIKSNAIVINQSNEEKYEESHQNDHQVKTISTKERGLSKSRNMALEYSSAELCVVCDDDLKYMDDCVEKIKKAYQKFPDADVIVFCVEFKDFKKKYPQKSKRINYLSSMRVCSVQITFKRKAILDKGIKFDEDFGTGSECYQHGEENIFLFDCLRKGLKIYFVPEYILKLDDSDSTWFNGYTEKYMKDQGAIFTRMAPKLYLLLNLQFLLRKYGLYSKSMGLCEAMKLMRSGNREYLERVWRHERA